MDYRQIGLRISKIRAYEKMTQAALAEKAGVSTSFIGHIERGERKPSICTLYAICAALGISLDYVVAGE